MCCHLRPNRPHLTQMISVKCSLIRWTGKVALSLSHNRPSITKERIKRSKKRMKTYAQLKVALRRALFY